VHEDNLHIIPDPNKGYPEPGIPADDAWSQMQEVLVKEMPQTPPSPDGLSMHTIEEGLINRLMLITS